MRIKNWAISVIFLTTAGMGLAQPALAQNDADSDSYLLEEVMVTATKREQSIYEVPMAVSAFTEDMIFRQGIPASKAPKSVCRKDLVSGVRLLC